MPDAMNLNQPCSSPNSATLTSLTTCCHLPNHIASSVYWQCCAINTCHILNLSQELCQTFSAAPSNPSKERSSRIQRSTSLAFTKLFLLVVLLVSPVSSSWYWINSMATTRTSTVVHKLTLRIPCPPPFSVPAARFLPHSYSPSSFSRQMLLESCLEKLSGLPPSEIEHCERA